MARSLRPWRGAAMRPLEDLYKEMDHLVQHFFGDEERAVAAERFDARINIAETESQYEVTVDLPGVKAEDVSVEVHEGQLTVAGKRESEKEESTKTFHRLERQYGEFRRSITLPAAVDEQKIAASYTDGVLTITLPKVEKVKPTRVQIKTGETED